MSKVVHLEKIENRILLIRGQKVMLDRDLAEFYGVETRILNQAVKRNKERFPDDFMFQLLPMETESLISQNVIRNYSRSQFVILNKRGKNIKYLPYVFTEQGVAMLSSVLRSKKAVKINILIMRAFVKIRKLVYSYKDLSDKIRKMETKYDGKIIDIYKILDEFNKKESNETEIGFKL